MWYLLWNGVPCLLIAFVLGYLVSRLLSSRKMAALRAYADGVQADLMSREAESLMAGGRVQILEQAANEAQAARSEARTRLAEKEREIETLRQQLQQVGQIAAGRATDLEQSYKHALAARDTEAASLVARIRELEPRLDAEQAARDEAIKALEEKDIEAAAHAGRVSSLERQTSRMAEMERALQAQLTAKQADYDGVTAMLLHHEAALEALRLQTESRSEEISRLNAFVQALEPLSAQLSEAERSLTKAIGAKNAEIDRLTNHSRQLEAALAAAIADRDRESAHWRGRTNSLEAALHAKEIELSAGSGGSQDPEISRLIARTHELEANLRDATASRDAEIARWRALAAPEATAILTAEPVRDGTADPVSVQRELHELLDENRVDFRDGTADLAPVSRFALDAVAMLLMRHPGLPVEVTSHTDNAGDFWQNYELTRWRAGAVRQYLVDRGIPADRLTSHGCGMTRPVADNNTPEGRQSNRRVELRVCTEMLAARGIARNGKL